MRAHSVVVSLVCLSACRETGPSQSTASDASASDASKGAPSSTPSVAAAHAEPKKLPGCRVVSGENGPSAAADATRWLDAPEKSTFAVRMIETGREVRFEGPAHVRPCANGVSLLASGAALGLPGAGEAPGNETWVAAPCAVVRWSSGITRVVASDGCKIQISLGTAYVWTPPGTKLESVEVDGGAPGIGEQKDGWQVISSRRAVRIAAPVDPEKAVLGCETAARETERISKAMGDAGADLGTLAVESLTARRNGRAACALASLRAAGNPDLERRVSAVDR